jgi:hypothetical protein
MMEFGDIFSYQLTTTVCVYGSLAFLAICAFAMAWLASGSSERIASPVLRPAV